jgi:hypothetical protein
MERKSEIQSRLESTSDKDWLNIVDELTKFVHFKLKGWKIKKGAHSEQNLGIDAINYYVNGAIEKVFSFSWEWKYEKYSLIDQLKVIIGSMMSSNVESYKIKKGYNYPIEDGKINALAEKESEFENDEQYDLFRIALEECSKNDEDLQLYVMALDECNSFDDISKLTGFEKKKLYVLQKKITRRIENYLKTKKESAL